MLKIESIGPFVITDCSMLNKSVYNKIPMTGTNLFLLYVVKTIFIDKEKPSWNSLGVYIENDLYWFVKIYYFGFKFNRKQIRTDFIYNFFYFFIYLIEEDEEFKI